jgi:hypothetical protein
MYVYSRPRLRQKRAAVLVNLTEGQRPHAVRMGGKTESADTRKQVYARPLAHL